MAEFINLGILCSKKDRDENDKLQYYIKLDKDVKITVNGKETTSDFIQVQTPANKLAKRIASGKLDEAKVEQLEKTMRRYLAPKDEEVGDLNYIKQELTIVLD
jgi:hypothetical protein